MNVFKHLVTSASVSVTQIDWSDSWNIWVQES